MGRPEKLGERADFERVFRLGSILSGEAVEVRWFDRSDDGAPRWGVVVSKKIGSAVQRNRLKRQLRSVIRSSRQGGKIGLRPGVDAVLVCRQGSGGKNYEQLSEEIWKILGDCGILYKHEAGER